MIRVVDWSLDHLTDEQLKIYKEIAQFSYLYYMYNVCFGPNKCIHDHVLDNNYT